MYATHRSGKLFPHFLRAGFAVLGVVCALSLASALGPGLLSAQEDASLSDFEAQPVRILTRNLYVGADIFQITQTTDPIPLAVAKLFTEMLATNFYERAEALADEIAATEPDLIGLQEVALIRRQSPGDFLIGNPYPAEDVVFDFLQILSNALAARGLDYRVVSKVQNADVEMPMLVGISGGQLLFDDVRLTDRDVILAGRNVQTGYTLEKNYLYNLQVTVGGIPIEFTRGFAIVEASVRNNAYRFANTHLEPYVENGAYQIQMAQAIELLDTINFVEAMRGPLPTVVVGDLNSKPEDPANRPYYIFHGYGYEDAWLYRKEGTAPGYTCCQAADLRNEVSSLSERIDHIFVRSDESLADGKVQAQTVGDEPGERTASGMWPSDHAGVFAKVRIHKDGSN